MLVLVRLVVAAGFVLIALEAAWQYRAHRIREHDERARRRRLLAELDRHRR